MNPSIKRLPPHLLWMAGIGIMVGSVVIFGHHGIPYQDATPGQIAEQKAGLAAFSRWSLIGSFLFLTGIIWASSRFLKNRDQPGS